MPPIKICELQLLLKMIHELHDFHNFQLTYTCMYNIHLNLIIGDNDIIMNLNGLKLQTVTRILTEPVLYILI